MSVEGSVRRVEASAKLVEVFTVLVELSDGLGEPFVRQVQLVV
jgi:hypothetical protein